MIFEVFRAYLREFSIFFREIFMVARSHRVLAADIKSLLISALVSLETRLKVPNFGHFLTIICIFQAVRFSISIGPRAMIFYYNLVQSMYFHVY